MSSIKNEIYNLFTRLVPVYAINQINKKILYNYKKQDNTKPAYFTKEYLKSISEFIKK